MTMAMCGQSLWISFGSRVPGKLRSGRHHYAAVFEGDDPVDAIVLDAAMPGEASITLARHAKELGSLWSWYPGVLMTYSSLSTTAYRCSKSHSVGRISLTR